MSLVAIITARGGSKRIPRKNIKDFCGKPILAYSIEAARQSGIFDEVMVSTDDDEIAEVARRYGASVPFLRSAENADDYASTADVLCEVIERYRAIGKDFDSLCCIYPTAPFVTAEKLHQAYDTYKRSDADALIPVVRFSYPPQRAFLERGGHLVYQYPEYERTRSQDLEPIYHDAGQFYFCKSQNLLQDQSLIGKSTVSFEIDELEVQDIDTLTDWQLAEMKYQLMHLRH